MAATVRIYEYNTSSATETVNIGSLDFVSLDQAGKTAVDSQLDIPTTTTPNYSYEKWIRLVVTDMGGVAELNSFKIWYEQPTEANLDTFNVGFTQTFATPINVVSTVAITTMPSASPGSANVTIAGSTGGSIQTVGNKTDYIVLQVGVDSTTVTPPLRALHVSWTEV